MDLRGLGRPTAWCRIALICLAMLAPRASMAQQGEAQAWAALAAGGHIALIRHAMTTPGVGDPPGWTLDNCSSQRNLNDQGRREATALGAALRARAVKVDSVLSSAWCRCLDTASLMNMGPATVEPGLANLFGNAPRAAEQTTALRRIIGAWRQPGTLVMISHGSTILALTGVSPLPAEVVVVAPRPPDGFIVVGRIPPPG